MLKSAKNSCFLIKNTLKIEILRDKFMHTVIFQCAPSDPVGGICKMSQEKSVRQHLVVFYQNGLINGTVYYGRKGRANCTL